MGWHCDTDLLRRYTAGAAGEVLAASVEAHLVRCADCRAALAALSAAGAYEPVWAGVQAAISRPVPPVSLRLLRRLGLAEADAVLLSASRSLRGPWALATACVLVFAVVASLSGDRAGTAFYLLAAPLVPVLGVVGAFTSARPADLAVATPYSKVRLTLLRTAAVTVTTVPAVAALGAVLPGIGWLAVGWLGPALLLTLVALVLLTWLPAPATGTVLTVGWTLVVGAARGGSDVTVAVAPAAQLTYLALAGAAAAVLAARVRSARTPGGYA